VLLLPTVPTTFTRAEIAEQPVARNLVLGRYTQFANLLDLAAVAIPAGTTGDGRPVGITLLGPAFSEARLLSVASQLSHQEDT
jgi:allophanate hydrolase